MGRYNRVIILIGLLVFPAYLFAQFNNNTSSPYSRFGLGDLHDYSFGRSVAMGGASIASRSHFQINLANPASYSAIDSLTFMFEFGMSSKFTNYSNSLGTARSVDANVEYLAMKFQINNIIGASLGLKPYSDIGYGIEVREEVENTGEALTKYFGSGTVSDAYFGIAVEPFDFLSLGVNLNYMFGKLNKNSELYFLDSPDSYGFQKYADFRLRDFGLDFGLQATLPLKNNKKIVLGVVYQNQPKYNSRFSDISQKNLQYNNVIDRDTLHYLDEQAGDIILPLTIGGGLSYVKDNVYEINVDYYHQSWSDATFFGQKFKNITDLNKFAVGGEWIPNKFSIRSYLSRVAYRAGFKYEETYLMFDDHQIKDFGISFGVGLPLYRSSSTINVSVELGERGTTDNGLILEKYARFNINMNLYDLWFIKRRFD